MVNVTALVVNYGTPGDLDKCVRSAEQFEQDLHWVVFDNRHPTVDSKPVIEQLAADLEGRLQYVFHDENLGHAYGINHASTLANTSNYFFIVNPDAYWTEPILERLVLWLQQDIRRAAVGPKQFDSAGRITAGGIIGSNSKPVHRYWQRPDPRNELGRDTIEVVTIPGSAIVISRDDFIGFGGLLATAHYFNETFLCYHLRAHDREVWYLGEVSMVHEWHKSTPTGSALTDGKFKSDQAIFRQACDSHDPPIPHD